MRKIVDLGGVHVGGRRIRRCAHPVKAGEMVEVFIDGLPLETFCLGDEPILYRDKFILALSKPAGIETQPTPARYRGTLYDALLRFLANPNRPQQRPSLGMVQRLDRDTSGVMVFSIHPQAHKGLTQAIAGRQAHKIYLALVSGNLKVEQGEFRSLLARNRASNLVRSVRRGGKEAITLFRVLERFQGATLVEIELVTGRSHQIRAHFSEAGHPLLGDVRYGGPAAILEQPVARQMLHSQRLSLDHPVTKEQLDLEAPLPEDMQGLVDHLRSAV